MPKITAQLLRQALEEGGAERSAYLDSRRHSDGSDVLVIMDGCFDLAVAAEWLNARLAEGPKKS